MGFSKIQHPGRRSFFNPIIDVRSVHYVPASLSSNALFCGLCLSASLRQYLVFSLDCNSRATIPCLAIVILHIGHLVLKT